MYRILDHLLRTLKIVSIGATFWAVSSSLVSAAGCGGTIPLAVGEARLDTQVTPGSTDRRIVTLEAAPLTMWQDGRAVGIYPDLITELDQRIGGRSVIRLVSLNRLMKVMLLGEAEYALMPKTNLAEENFTPLAKVGEIEFIVWPRKGLVIRHTGDMQGLVYSALRNGFFSRIFDAEPLMAYMPFDHYGQAVTMFKGGRTDALTGASSALAYAVDAQELDFAELGQPFLFTTSEVWLYFSRDKPVAMVPAGLVPALKAMQAEGRYQAHRQRYVENNRLPAVRTEK